MTHPAPGYRKDIDGLRALAVLCVVGYHAFPGVIPGGFIGVDIFFVISGYLITGILLNNIDSGRFSLADFYARRIRRLFPALILMLLFCLLAGWWIFLSDEYKTLGENTLASVFYLSNFYLWQETDYFDITAEFKPILHLWSLAVEEQFYIVWPLLLFFLAKNKKYLLAGILLLVLVSFVSCLSSYNDSTSRFFLPHNRFWELLIGALLCQGIYLTALDKISPHLKSITGLLMIAAAVFLLDKHSTFPGWAALLPTLGAFLLISAGENAWINRKLFSTPAVVFVGLISYPLYLWHWPLLSFARVLEGGEISVTLRFICVASSFVLAWLTYRLVEIPLRTPKKWRVELLLLVATLIGVAGYLAARDMIKPRSMSHGIENILKEIDEWEMPQLDQEIHFENQLFISQGNTGEQVMFIGDSNMAQYAARINKQVAENSSGKGAILATVGGCMPVPGVGRPDNENCLAFMRSSYRYAKESEHISTVVIAGLWISYFYGAECFLEQASGKIPVNQNPEQVYATLENAIRELVASGKKVYLIGGIPSGSNLDPRNLFNRSAANFRLDLTETGGIPRKDITNIENINAQLLLMAKNTGATFIDPVSYLCDAERCPLFTANGQMIYKDAVHLTMSFVREKATFIDSTLQ